VYQQKNKVLNKCMQAPLCHKTTTYSINVYLYFPKEKQNKNATALVFNRQNPVQEFIE